MAGELGYSTPSQTETVVKKPGALDAFLTTIERVGNKVPHPGIIFFILIGLVIVLSAVFGFLGTSITYPHLCAKPESSLTFSALLQFLAVQARVGRSADWAAL